jgi:hypothetical protein
MGRLPKVLNQIQTCGNRQLLPIEKTIIFFKRSHGRRMAVVVLQGPASRGKMSRTKGNFMRVDTSRIEERIRKLQEIKRIAADSEMVEMLSEFIDFDEEAVGRSPEVVHTGRSEGAQAAPQSDEVRDLINDVVRALPGSSHPNGRRS